MNAVYADAVGGGASAEKTSTYEDFLSKIEKNTEISNMSYAEYLESKGDTSELAYKYALDSAAGAYSSALRSAKNAYNSDVADAENSLKLSVFDANFGFEKSLVKAGRNYEGAVGAAEKKHGESVYAADVEAARAKAGYGKSGDALSRAGLSGGGYAAYVDDAVSERHGSSVDSARKVRASEIGTAGKEYQYAVSDAGNERNHDVEKATVIYDAAIEKAGNKYNANTTNALSKYSTSVADAQYELLKADTKNSAEYSKYVDELYKDGTLRMATDTHPYGSLSNDTVTGLSESFGKVKTGNLNILGGVAGKIIDFVGEDTLKKYMIEQTSDKKINMTAATRRAITDTMITQGYDDQSIINVLEKVVPAGDKEVYWHVG